MKVRTTGDGPEKAGHHGADEEATRVFTRLSTFEPDARDLRDDADHPGDDHARTFRRISGGAEAAAPPEPAPTRTFTRDTLSLPGRDGPPDEPDRLEDPQTLRRPARTRRPRSIGRIVRRTVALLVLTVILLPCATWAWVWYTARQDERPPSDAIVVLGASQYNGRPSPVFEARLRHAAHLYEEGVAPTVVTVGGNQPGDNFTEGGSGARWLVEQGVPADSVIPIGKGSDTLESLELVAQVFEERGWRTAVIVSDPWHSLRSREIAEDFGIEAATSPARSGPAVLERETQLWYITRETASLWHYWIFGESAAVRVDAL
ncbi:YdcF family protein [Thermobifida fusca]|uniref:YdcF family protein n=1 Tax=Thermobifida fusca TaxID=2021 RepID=UPI001877A49D|nr:YdcF family protein [Thermobifida fusca]QOS57534.1 YdcF family protein [Thermobifida fusca]